MYHSARELNFTLNYCDLWSIWIWSYWSVSTSPIGVVKQVLIWVRWHSGGGPTDSGRTLTNKGSLADERTTPSPEVSERLAKYLIGLGRNSYSKDFQLFEFFEILRCKSYVPGWSSHQIIGIIEIKVALNQSPNGAESKIRSLLEVLSVSVGRPWLDVWSESVGTVHPLDVRQNDGSSIGVH